MNYTKFIPLLLAPLLLAASALPQTTDWNAVRDLPPETKIHVTLKNGNTFGHCFFEGIRDDGALVCRRGGPFGLASRPLAYPQDSIKAVYLAHNGTLIGAAVGAGTGAIVGASKSGCCRGASALVGAGLMAAPGMIIGTMLDPFFHGRAVYRSPQDPNKSRNSPSAPKDKAPSTNQPDCLRDGVTLRCITKEAPAAQPAPPVGDR